MKEESKMKESLKTLAIAFVVLSLGMSFGAVECYAGGTLTDSTVKEWKQATHENKMLTSGAWITAALLLDMINTDTLHGINTNGAAYMLSLVVCINEAVEGHTTVDNANTSEVAAMGMMIMGWIK